MNDPPGGNFAARPRVEDQGRARARRSSTIRPRRPPKRCPIPTHGAHPSRPPRRRSHRAPCSHRACSRRPRPFRLRRHLAHQWRRCRALARQFQVILLRSKPAHRLSSPVRRRSRDFLHPVKGTLHRVKRSSSPDGRATAHGNATDGSAAMGAPPPKWERRPGRSAALRSTKERTRGRSPTEHRERRPTEHRWERRLLAVLPGICARRLRTTCRRAAPGCRCGQERCLGPRHRRRGGRRGHHDSHRRRNRRAHATQERGHRRSASASASVEAAPRTAASRSHARRSSPGCSARRSREAQEGRGRRCEHHAAASATPVTAVAPAAVDAGAAAKRKPGKVVPH